MYRCADLSRTFVLVVALLLTAVSTGAFARKFCAVDPQNERHPAKLALHDLGGPAAERGSLGHRIGMIDLTRTNVALIGAATPVWIGRLRKVDRI